MPHDKVQSGHDKSSPAAAPAPDVPTATARAFGLSPAALEPGERALSLLRGAGIAALVAIPIFLWSYQGAVEPHRAAAEPALLPVAWPGGRIIWTVIIALLPLFIVSVGFYTWRRICPLAFFGRMSEWLQWPDRSSTPNAGLARRRVPKWVAVNYPVLTGGFLTAILALRLLLINSDAVALGATFAGLCALAVLCSFCFTGKTWCNFFCPVGSIERVYTDTDRPGYRRNSQCAKCTGCKTVPSGGLCPDINQENDYWQEIRNRSRAWAFYSWPGIVVGFYLWYYLHKPYYWHSSNHAPDASLATLLPAPPGTDWGYYLSGDWTREQSPWLGWLAPGFGFHGLPGPIAHLPTIVAAPLTLVLAGVASYTVFAVWESWLLKRASRRGQDTDRARESVRHTLFSFAGFAAFVCFYQFAGAPTLGHLPFGLYGAFRLGIAVLATTVLVTRLKRTRARQLQYDQARRWLQRWPLPGAAPPDDLEEAYTLVTEHLRTSEERMRLFQSTVQGMLADNLITASEIGLLDRMAADLGLGEAEKKKVVRQLSSAYPGLFTGSLDDALRLLGYRAELERSISENRSALPEPGALRAMQARYRIQHEEHEAVLRELRDPNGARTESLRTEADGLRRLQRDATLLMASSLPAIRFLHHELAVRAADERDHILEVANLYGTAGELTGLARAVRQNDSEAIAAATDWIQKQLPPTVAQDVAEAISPIEPVDTASPPDAIVDALLRWSEDSDVILRAAATYGLGMAESVDTSMKQAAAARAEAGLTSEEPLVREAAVAALAPRLSVDQWKAALNDASDSVRRSAILRVQPPINRELLSLVEAARSDADAVARLFAAQIIDGPDALTSARAQAPTMTRLEKMFALRSLRLLEHLPAEALRDLAGRAVERIYLAGEVLCTEGEQGDDVFLLLEGETEAVHKAGGADVRLGLSHPGETVGEMGILDPAPRMATVRPTSPVVRVLIVHGADFRALLARDTSASLGVIRLLIQRQRELSK
jgi:hypothetical protein